MRALRTLLGAALVAASLPGAPAGAAGSVDLAGLASVARLAARQVAASGATVISEVSDARVMPVADLDGDGVGDVLTVLAEQAIGGSTLVGLLSLRAVSGATGETIWGPVTFNRYAARFGSTSLTMPPPATITVGWRFGPESMGDILVSVPNTLGVTSLYAISGEDGSRAWTQSDNTIGIPQVRGQAILLLPLTTPVEDPRNVIVGRYTGVAGAWRMQVNVVDVTSGFSRMITEAVGTAYAPTATFASTVFGLDRQVVVAEAIVGPTRTIALMRVHDHQGLYPELPRDIWRTDAPTSLHAVGLSLRPLVAEQSQPTGVLLGFDIADPDADFRARLEGPASLVGVGRDGVERLRIELPSATNVGIVADETGDRLPELRTARVELDSIVTETWDAHGINARIGSHRTTMLEGGFDYRRLVAIGSDLGDVDGDGRDEWLVSGGFPCGPRVEAVTRDRALWARPEVRAFICAGDMLPAGGSLDAGTTPDVVEWNSISSCCPTFPHFVRVRGIHGSTGATLWETELPGLQRTETLHARVGGGTLFAAAPAAGGRAYGLDPVSGALRWAIDL